MEHEDFTQEQLSAQHLRRYAKAAESLTPDQIAAVAYTVAGITGWTKEEIISKLIKNAEFWEGQHKKNHYVPTQKELTQSFV